MCNRFDTFLPSSNTQLCIVCTMQYVQWPLTLPILICAICAMHTRCTRCNRFDTFLSHVYNYQTPTSACVFFLTWVCSALCNMCNFFALSLSNLRFNSLFIGGAAGFVLVCVCSQTDMKFVKNFTQPDFQAKSFTPQK